MKFTKIYEKLEILYYKKRDCRSLWKWIFEWSWGVNKWGEREWALRIFGLVIQNEIEE